MHDMSKAPIACFLPALFAITMAPHLTAQAPAVGQVSTAEAQRTLNQLIADMQSTAQQAGQLRERMGTAENAEEAQELYIQLQELSDKLQRLSQNFTKKIGTYKLETNPLRNEIQAALDDPDLKKSLAALLKIEKKEAAKSVKDPLLTTIRYCVAETYRLRGEELAVSRNRKSDAMTNYKNSIKYFKRALTLNDLRDNQIGTSVHAACRHGLIRMHAALFRYYDDSFRAGNQGSLRNRTKYRKDGIMYVTQLQRLHGEDLSLNPKSSMKQRRFIDLANNDIQRLTSPKR